MSEHTNQSIDDNDFIDLKLNLPDYSNEISTAEDKIDKLKSKIQSIIQNNQIDNINHNYCFEEVVKSLDFLGRLSKPCFDAHDKIEEAYTIKFNHSPQLAKKLWLDHTEKIHHPYTILKNRCFRLLEELDDAYIKKYNKYPPNWEI